jgi:hypothetical protein
MLGLLNAKARQSTHPPSVFHPHPTSILPFLPYEMDPLAASVAAVSLSPDNQAPYRRRQTVLRLTLPDLPAEILFAILLMVRDASVAEAGYTQDGFDLPSSTSENAPPWMAVTNVCARLRAVALAMPELWTIILLEDGASWATVIAQRSGTMPVSVYARRRPTADTRKDGALLATIPHLGARVSRLIVHGYDFTRVQILLDSLDWTSLALTALSVGDFTGRPLRFVIRLPQAFLADPGPQLSSLGLEYLSLDPATPHGAFKNVRRLRLEQPQFGGRGTSVTAQIESMCMWLKAMPVLEEITLLHPPQDYSVDVSDDRRVIGRSHPYLKKLSITRIYALRSTLELLNEISLPSEALVISCGARGWISSSDSLLDRYHIPRLVNHLRRFWGQAATADTNAGVADQHIPTIRVQLEDGDPDLLNVTLNLDRSHRPTLLQLHFLGPPDCLPPVLRKASQMLFPMYTIEELRVYGPQSLASDALSGDLHLLDSCRTLIVDSMDLAVPGFAMLPTLRELRILSTEANDCPDPGPLLQWLLCRDSSDAPQLERLTLKGASGLKGPENGLAMDVIRLLVGDLCWE